MKRSEINSAILKAKERLDKKANDTDIKLAELKLKRALNRINIYDKSR